MELDRRERELFCNVRVLDAGRLIHGLSLDPLCGEGRAAMVDPQPKVLASTILPSSPTSIRQVRCRRSSSWRPTCPRWSITWYSLVMTELVRARTEGIDPSPGSCLKASCPGRPRAASAEEKVRMTWAGISNEVKFYLHEPLEGGKSNAI